MLILLSGLPGTGKSTLADALGRALPAAVFSVDPIESVMVAAGLPRGFTTGLAAYGVAQRLTGDHLALGQSVVADAVNDVEEARDAWREIAARNGVRLRVVECVCSDPALHRERLEARDRGLAIPEPTWDSVQRRREGWRPWPEQTVVADSARSLPENLSMVLAAHRPPAAT
ncbi:AAA family ATPase [Planotetraspora kaengkrachanensis]|uniref:Kinase n=1 Tax=Planotetraspora kaengkrachanensis TaxID=575193 RepID=A0A8J3Q1G3_9ACTN|nr:AAA family ATPase [Planotetraspora kaengkrachanensis]GIG84818.1 kinase [Planotetraspora kaengkrachanensis]